MSKLRVVFMGSPEFAVPCLEALLATEDVVAVVTQPDKPAGRGLGVQPPAVKVRALAAGVPVMQPASVRKPPFLDELRALAPDVCVVVAYGKILPPEVLAVPAARLPQRARLAAAEVSRRGADPVGDHPRRARDRRDPDADGRGHGHRRHAAQARAAHRRVGDRRSSCTRGWRRSAPSCCVDGLARLKAGTLVRTKQDDAQATMAPMLTKETGRVDFAAGARAVRDLARGCDPWPTACTLLDGEPLKLFRAKMVSGRGAPGVVLGADRDGLIVGCGDDAVAFGELQLPGKKRMPAQALLAGRPIPRPATQLGA